MHRLPWLISLLVAVSAALVILGIAITPFLSPTWVAFEQGRADAAAWTGYSATDLRTATDSILSDLVIGPPAFDVTVGGEPVLNASERSHMRDVRHVFSGFYLLAGGALVILVLARLAARRSSRWSTAMFLGAVRAGTTGLLVGVVIAGVVAATAFDAAFEVFHSLFFAAGTYNFDPSTERLVQLFPDVFWSETTIAVGIAALALALVVRLDMSRRIRGLTGASTPPAGTAS